MKLRISEDLYPISALKTHPNKVVAKVQRTGRPVVLTRYGKGTAVLMSVEEYESLQSAAARLEVIAALQEAENAIARGDVVEHEEMERLLGEWSGGGG